MLTTAMVTDEVILVKCSPTRLNSNAQKLTDSKQPTPTHGDLRMNSIEASRSFAYNAQTKGSVHIASNEVYHTTTMGVIPFSFSSRISRAHRDVRAAPASTATNARMQPIPENSGWPYGTDSAAPHTTIIIAKNRRRGMPFLSMQKAKAAVGSGPVHLMIWFSDSPMNTKL